ncbi:GlcG/HbpS family heme-binding protein [Microbacterium aurantiacum]|uniref:Heme-binding protein n=1 Tax=Microbacterium aurantiacum TaxID=162393 RepID=A0AAJ2HJX1_9MICO|nr:heme-binding protein [Microbacterium aurantiacum]MDS0246967.1 heme-binding protein [Microbacterium aurantiacum]
MPKYIDTPTITLETALEAVEAAVRIGAEQGVRVISTVVDPGLELVAFGRADGATPHSVETSGRKARTAASTRRATGWMEGDFATQAPLGTGLLLTNIRGGVPIVFDGRIVGGLGVAGGTPSQDAEIAAAVLSAIKAEAVE